MRRYILKKILLIFPSLLLYSILVFFLSKLAPGDPVQNLVGLQSQQQDEFNSSMYSNNYHEIAEELGLDLPAFYFSVAPSSLPDTFYRIVHPQEKKILKNWIKQGAIWGNIQKFKNAESLLLGQLNLMLPSPLIESSLREIKHIGSQEDLLELEKSLIPLMNGVEQNNYFESTQLRQSFIDYESLLYDLRARNASLFSLFPAIHWHGLENQYHQWMKKAIFLDMGLSSIDAQPVLTKLFEALFWTLLYVMVAYVISLTIAIPMGMYTAWKQNQLSEKIISIISFIFYAFPLFWLATLAVVFLTNDIYSPWLDIFPAVGVSNHYRGDSVISKIIQAFPHLILPALILSLHSAASGIRIIRNSAIVELKAEYHTTAKAKGLSQMKILRKHILPNAMLPVITMLVSGFPAALAGSVVIEVIFNIPGMGRLLFDSIHYMDWNVVFAILLFIGLFTFLFYLLGDILYALLNPKIKYD